MKLPNEITQTGNANDADYDTNDANHGANPGGIRDKEDANAGYGDQDGVALISGFVFFIPGLPREFHFPAEKPATRKNFLGMDSIPVFLMLYSKWAGGGG